MLLFFSGIFNKLSSLVCTFPLWYMKTLTTAGFENIGVCNEFTKSVLWGKGSTSINRAAPHMFVSPTKAAMSNACSWLWMSSCWSAAVKLFHSVRLNHDTAESSSLTTTWAIILFLSGSVVVPAPRGSNKQTWQFTNWIGGLGKYMWLSDRSKNFVPFALPFSAPPSPRPPKWPQTSVIYEIYWTEY